MSELHAFEVDVAKDVGVVAAVVFYELEFWVGFNAREGKNKHKGEYWTYQSAASLARELPYLTERQIRYSIEKLIKSGYIKRGNFNKKGYDKTKWYTICADKIDSFVSFPDKSVLKIDSFVAENDKMSQKVSFLSDASYKSDGKSDKSVLTSDNFVRPYDNFVRPIPVTNTVTNLKGKENTKRKFVPPTREELVTYCESKGISFDFDYFIDYYTSNGWVVGKNKMRDWKATARNWARRNNDKPRAKTQPVNEFEALKEELAKGGSLF